MGVIRRKSAHIGSSILVRKDRLLSQGRWLTKERKVTGCIVGRHGRVQEANRDKSRVDPLIVVLIVHFLLIIITLMLLGVFKTAKWTGREHRFESTKGAEINIRTGSSLVFALIGWGSRI